MVTARSRRSVRVYAHTVVTTVVVLVFALAEWTAARFISDHSRIVSSALEIAIVLVATLAFRPIHQRIDQIIEDAFTRKRRAARDALIHLKKELSSYSDTEHLLRRVIEAVDHHTEADGSAIYLRRDKFRPEASSFDTRATHVELDDPLAVRLRSAASPANPKLLESAAAGSIAFPMTVAGELIGFMSIERARGDYDPEECDVLEALLESTAVALVALEPHLQTPAHKAKGNIPAGLSQIVGRETDIHAIKTQLEHHRLVTIVGAGGIGKTRAAIQVAASTSHRDGAFLIDFAPLEDSALVAAVIAQALDISDDGGRIFDKLIAHLKARRTLLVLDNCEHVVDSVSGVAKQILTSCQHVRILATSREPLGLEGESPYRLPVLDEDSAVKLFVSRVKTALGTFDLTPQNEDIVRRIVRHLDGIALAIELAAPRAKVLTLEQLEERIASHLTALTSGDRTEQPRHKTMRALIGWSYDQLNDQEKDALQRSAVFRGTWTLEAIEALCSRVQAEDVAEVLLSLVDKSLVNLELHGNERRYRLLEPTRQFALERLEEAGGRDDVAADHHEYFCKIGAARGDAYWTTDFDSWLASIRPDLENTRSAITWGLHEGHTPNAAAALISNLRWFWYTTSRREGRELLERAGAFALDARTDALVALAQAVLDSSAAAATQASIAANALSDAGDTVLWIEAVTFLGISSGRAGRTGEALAHFEEAIAAVRDTKMPRFIAWVLSMAAYWMEAAHEADRARALFDEAADQLRLASDSWQLARLQLHRAELLFAEDDPDAALATVHEAERVFRERNADSGLCVSVVNAAAYLISLSRHEEAWEKAREGLEISLRLGNPMPGVWAIGHLARLTAERGDVERAARLLGYTDAAYQRTGTAREPTEQRGYDQTLALVSRSLPEARIAALIAEGARLEHEQAIAEATTAQCVEPV